MLDLLEQQNSLTINQWKIFTIWGAGPAFQFPTATNNELGTGQVVGWTDRRAGL